ncbi:50S ribosomal protein L31 [Fannyhessea vaginae]|uniref:50S ribosomal protein L31 n=1 Tax=Fannyhessea vaginae TaxID=82135 RepID=UPI00061D7471|nr:50S ribosomal protein L31 [Fannyhessea vaginae]KMT47606.1 50S ribosomal protein L31 [Fannyhessea vaginae]CRH61955.1 50S ribosomal protein L31 type B [Chlamydia trachomatis]
MKQGIHPNYVECTVRCTCGNTWQTHSTKSELTIDLCDKCHPFYTGQQKLVDTGGRVQRFSNKFGGAAAAQLKAAQEAKEAKAAKAAEEAAAQKAAAEEKAAKKAKRAAEFEKRAAAKAAKEAAKQQADAAAAQDAVEQAADKTDDAAKDAE